MKNKTLENKLLEHFTANSWWKPVIIGGLSSYTTIALQTVYKDTATCQFVVNIHYDEIREEISLLQLFPINGFINSGVVNTIEQIIDVVNAEYKQHFIDELQPENK